MKQMEDFELIEGEFSPKEAKELLLNLLGSKIQFHTNKNFSTEICTGEPEKRSLEKITALRSIRERMTALLEEAQQKNLSIEVRSSVKIYFSNKTGAD